jgi:hypothetical protein
MLDFLPHNLAKRGSVEFVSSATIIIDTIHPLIKAGWDSVRYVGSIQRGNHAAPIFRSAGSRTRLPSTTQYLRRILHSVTSLASTYKTWWTAGELNPVLRRAKAVCSQLYQQPKFTIWKLSVALESMVALLFLAPLDCSAE